MNLSEAKAKFPIGSMAKVVNRGGEYTSYSEWGRKNLLHDDYAAWLSSRGQLCDGDIGEVIAVAPHGKFDDILAGIKVGKERIAIIHVNAIEPISFALDGENLVVAAYGETETFSLSEIIEELRAKCLKKKNAIKVGDKVRIVDGDQCYPTYKDWLKENADFDQALMFDWEHTPKCGDEATVLVIAKHSDSEEKLLYLVSVKHEDVTRNYLMAEDGIDKI